MNTNNMQDLRRLLPLSSGVTTDSRKAATGKIFFALKGDNFDGNEFAPSVIAQGALCAVVSSDSKVGCDILSGRGDVLAPEKYIVVNDTLKALQDLARWYRQQFNIPVIALTGTNGKTTTKELLNVALSVKYRVTATLGNLNNHIGVPLTLLSITKDTEIAVIEMGASAPGEIETLVNIAQPDYGLITNVGKAHLQGFGSFEGVKKTKGELYDYLQTHNGFVFYNVDNKDLCEMVDSRPGLRTGLYGSRYQRVNIIPANVYEPFLHMDVPAPMLAERIDVRTHLIGAYNADNVLAALCVAKQFGVMLNESAAAIARYYPSNSRSQLKQTERNMLILDTYNANPTSMRTSVENFGGTMFEHKTLILGDMLELGAESREEHKAILKLVSGMNVESIYLVGKEFGALKSDVQKASIRFFETVTDLIDYLSREPLEGKTILIKGSNGIHLQSLSDKL